MILDPQATPLEVYLFESPDLPNHWTRLDEFEGVGYRRVVTQVRTAEGEVNAWIYVIAEGNAHQTEVTVNDGEQ
jgi:gamma-glutamylcyclotransferase (GGCT)/AIG2-like uncharacterized protein YtfP